MKKVKVISDKAGNTLYLDGVKRKLAVRNREGKIVDMKSFEKFMRQKGMRKALEKKVGKAKFIGG